MMIQGASGNDFSRFPLWLALLSLLCTGCSHKSVDDYLDAGDQAMQSDRLAEAESDYQQAAQVAPKDPRPRLVLADLYVLELKPQQAADEATKALELDPNDPRAHAALATAYKAESKVGPAEAQGRAAVVLAPADAQYRLSLGATLESERQLAEAEAEYRTAEGLKPRDAHAYLALGLLLNAEPNRQDDAQAEFARVKALDPSLLPANVQPVNSPSPFATATPATTPKGPAMEETDQRYLLAHDSPVYNTMGSDAHVIAQVYRRQHVHVTGLSPNWLRIQLRNGSIGYIPASTAE